MKNTAELPDDIAYWALDVNSALHQVGSNQNGLDSVEPARHVIVKRLNFIKNFGSMDVLCSDKTRILMEGKAKVFQWTNCFGNENA